MLNESPLQPLDEQNQEQRFREGSRKAYLANHFLALCSDHLDFGEPQPIARAKLIELWITGAYGLKLFNKPDMISTLREESLLDLIESTRGFVTSQKSIFVQLDILSGNTDEIYSYHMTLSELESQVVADIEEKLNKKTQSEGVPIPLTAKHRAEASKPLKPLASWFKRYDIALASQLRVLQRTQTSAQDHCVLALMLVCTPVLLQHWLDQIPYVFDINLTDSIILGLGQRDSTKILEENLLYFITYFMTLKGKSEYREEYDPVKRKRVKHKVDVYLLSELDPSLSWVKKDFRNGFSKIISDLTAFYGITRIALLCPKSCALLVQMFAGYFATLYSAGNSIPIMSENATMSMKLDMSPHLSAYDNHMEDIYRRLKLLKAIPIKLLR